jgi:hypothetical protein
MGAAASALRTSGGYNIDPERPVAGGTTRFITPTTLLQVSSGVPGGGGGGGGAYFHGSGGWAPVTPPTLVQEATALKRAGFVRADTVRLLSLERGRYSVTCELDLFAPRTEVRIFWGALAGGARAPTDPLTKGLLVKDPTQSGSVKNYFTPGRGIQFTQSPLDSLDPNSVAEEELTFIADPTGRREPPPNIPSALLYPLIIALTAVDAQGVPISPSACHLTLCTLAKISDGWCPVVLAQHEQLGERCFIVKDFFGRAECDGVGGGSSSGDHNDDNSSSSNTALAPPAASATFLATEASNCVICLSDARTTAVLPCRHLCLCAPCAQQLVFHSSRCPVCRGPASSLLSMTAGGAAS